MKQRYIKKRAREVDVEDIFLDRAVKEREEGIEQVRMEVPLKKGNFVLLLFLIVGVLSSLLFFTLRLEAKQEEYNLLAEKNQFISLRYSSERGIIYDRNKIPLLENEASFDLFFDPGKAEEGDVQKITSFFDDVSFSTSTELMLIKSNIQHKDLVMYETKKQEMPYLLVSKRILRKYENEGALGHILGYLGKISKQEFLDFEGYDFTDYIGRTGAEKSFENILKEKKGTIKIERTAEGKELSREMVENPKSGDSIVLSIDFELQEQSRIALERVLVEVGSEKGVVIAIDPRNGEILSLISLPCYDNNLFAAGISKNDWEKINNNENNPQLNRAIGGLYPTGSSIKPIVALGALEEGIITEETNLYCPKELCIENKYDKETASCFPDWEYHGWTDVKRAIAESVNPFFYMIAGGYTAPRRSSEFFNEYLPRKMNGLGAFKLAEYLSMFGLGKKTGIDLQGEVEGRVPTPDWKEEYFEKNIDQKWYLGDTYNLSIGQGYLLATPIQMAVVFSAVANNGHFIQPHLLKSIIKENNAVEDLEYSSTSIAFKHLETVRQGMRQTVSMGSATRLNRLPVKVSAKTGTAQVYTNKDIYHNWIVSFAPYENPEIVIVILIESVEGAKVAAQSVAFDVLNWYFKD